MEYNIWLGCTPVHHSLPFCNGIVHPLGRHPLPYADTPQAETPQTDTPLGRHRQADPHKTATEAVGTHPTGMHSCLSDVMCQQFWMAAITKNLKNDYLGSTIPYRGLQ